MGLSVVRTEPAPTPERPFKEETFSIPPKLVGEAFVADTANGVEVVYRVTATGFSFSGRTIWGGTHLEKIMCPLPGERTVRRFSWRTFRIEEKTVPIQRRWRRAWVFEDSFGVLMDRDGTLVANNSFSAKAKLKNQASSSGIRPDPDLLDRAFQAIEKGLREIHRHLL